MKPDGVAGSNVPAGSSTVRCRRTKNGARGSPVSKPALPARVEPPSSKVLGSRGNALGPRVTRVPFNRNDVPAHGAYLSGAMSRLESRLPSCQPEFFVEISPELGRTRRAIGHNRLDTSRRRVAASAVRRSSRGGMRAFTIAGRPCTHVGMPFHWGLSGLVSR